MEGMDRVGRDDLHRICRRHGVVRLAVFGSWVREGAFDPDRSDIDFVVEFSDMSPGEHKRAYFGLLFELEELFERSVDLVEAHTVSNPYVRRHIEQSQETVYGVS